MIDDRTRTAAVGKGQLASCHERCIVQIERAADETAYIDLRAPPDDDATRVEQKNLTIGVDPAEDFARAAADHPVEDRGAGAWLDEVHAVARAHAETAPVYGRTLARLRDGQRVTGHRPDRGRASSNLPPRGKCCALGVCRQGRSRNHESLRNGHGDTSNNERLRARSIDFGSAAGNPVRCCHLLPLVEYAVTCRSAVLPRSRHAGTWIRSGS